MVWPVSEQRKEYDILSGMYVVDRSTISATQTSDPRKSQVVRTPWLFF